MIRSWTPKTLSLAKFIPLSLKPSPLKAAEAGKDLLQRLTEGRAEVLAGKAVCDIGRKKAPPIAAIIGLALEFEAKEAVFGHELDHRIGKLDLTAGAGVLRGDAVEYLRLQDITAGNDQIGGSLFKLRLLDHAVDAEAATEGGADLDPAIPADLVGRHLLDGDDIAAGVGIDLHHLLEAAGPGVDQHVGQKQGEGLAADELAGTPDGVTEPQRLLLAGEAGLAGGRQVLLQKHQLGLLAAPLQGFLQLELLVEMILNDAFVPPCDEDEMLAAGFAGLVNRKLDDRTVHNRKHFLGHRLGGGQKPGTETSDWENGLLDGALHGEDLVRGGIRLELMAGNHLGNFLQESRATVKRCFLGTPTR